MSGATETRTLPHSSHSSFRKQPEPTNMHSANPSSRPSTRPHLALSINSLAFPDTDYDAVHATPKARHRPSVPPHSPSYTLDLDNSLPALRYSGSSAATQPDTPPHTPTTPIQVVSAPVSGVETMDAMVDGLNTFDPDDPFLTSSIHRVELKSKRRNRSAYSRSTEDQPPLPTIPLNLLKKLPSPQATAAKPVTPSRIPRPKQKDTPATEPVEYNQQPSVPSSRVSPSSRSSANTGPPGASSSSPSQTPPKTRSSARTAAQSSIIVRRDPPPKAIIPSISDIIKSHAPAYSKGRITSLAERNSEDLISRSSIDTIAEEVQHTLRNIPDGTPDSKPFHPKSFSPPQISSPPPSLMRSDSSSKTNSPYQPGPVSQAESIATYLRSPRLTTLIKVPRHLQSPLQVSLSDLGDPNGRPLVVFLGLGSVRYLMGLYDEMAEILGLRLITIDRWGLGRTSSESTSAKGIKEWARVVADILSRMGIEHCSIMAHSAGAPYALSFANLRPECVKGDICLLAPWVGGGENTASYKWLKYVPNSLLKTAQAAEWRMQTWMLGKPPTVNYQGIGFDRNDPTASTSSFNHSSPTSFLESSDVKSVKGSIRSSEYDDLADFDGRFESRSTLTSPPNRCASESMHGPVPVGRSFSDTTPKRRTSRGILNSLLSRSSSASAKQREVSLAPCTESTKAQKLSKLRSVSSLKGSSKSGVAPSIASRATTITSPALPPIGLGFSDFDWSTAAGSVPSPSTPDYRSRRSISLTARMSSDTPTSRRGGMNHSTPPQNVSSERRGGTIGYQAALANALIAASHAESSRGVHSDLVQILNQEGRSWGFSYSSYPHKVRLWYGEKDERIAESTVRWMEKTMTPQRCEVKVIKGADHALMYRSGVVVEVLETVRSFWS